MFHLFVICVVIFIVYKILNKILRDENKPSNIPSLSSSSPSLSSPSLSSSPSPSLSLSSSIHNIPWSNELFFILNGVEVRLINPDPQELLAKYVRERAGLKGTKLGCEEGGCGACTVVLTKSKGTISVNSCLRPLCTNDGYSITTIEGIGSIGAGLSIEQQNLVDNHGTQCGFCTPGWITNMHALNTSIEESNSRVLNGREIDAYFDGNICRCTGYKPILKSFKKNCSPEDCAKCPRAGTSACEDHNNTELSIEDIGLHKIISDSPSLCLERKRSSRLLTQKQNQILRLNYTPLPLHFTGYQTHWYRPIDLSQLCAILREYSTTPNHLIQLVGGNTSIGVTKYLNNTSPYNTQDVYSIFIDINSIPELSSQAFDPLSRTLTIGATTTLTELIGILNTYSKKIVHFNEDVIDESKINHHSIFSVTAHHLRKIANTQVRNAGTWAGNLGIFKKYSSFPSDVVIAFTTARAIVSLCDMRGFVQQISMDEFIQMESLNGFLILNVEFKESNEYSLLSASVNTVAETFKICIREHNAHAQVNAGFNFDIVQDHLYSSHGPLCQQARIVFGGVSAKTFIAYRTESVLTNSRLTTSILQRALQALEKDLEEVGMSTGYGDSSYRKSVMQSCLYRSLLRSYRRNDIPSNIISATFPFFKPQSRGTEVFTEVENKGPIYLPVPKLEAKAQTTGEAVYPSDEPLPPQGLCAALVFTSQCACLLSDIDPTLALSIRGVVAFFDAKDIPGKNSISIGTELFLPVGQEVLCVGMPVGIIIAISDEIANHAASLVTLTYTSIGKTPIATLQQAIDQKAFYPVEPVPGVTILRAGDPEIAMKSATRRVKGSLSALGQNHFYMETQSAVASVIDGDILEIICGSQDLTTFQSQIISVLNLKASQVQVKCPRIGGAFGGKLTGGIVEATATGLAARLVKRPVRLFNTRTSDMYIHSGREGYVINYEIGFDESGKIVALIYDLYCDAGCANQDAFECVYMAMRWADNAFYLPNYLARTTFCFTNTPPRTFARAPGCIQSSLATSVVIQRVASELRMDEEYVKSINFLEDGLTSIGGQVITNSTLDRCWQTLLRRSLYHHRLTSIQKFNSENLWRKRGISIEPVKYGIGYAFYNGGCHIGIFKSDGTITVSHNGVEMGQGINTKVAQVVSAELGVDISFIRVTAPSTTRIANGGTTGGSGTSEVCCQAALQACRTLNHRLKSYKDNDPTVSWVELLAMLPPDISLNADGWYSPPSNSNGEEFQYYVWGACVSEVEYDVLSGMVNVISAEIIYDNGLSLNPYIDLGQIEGAFVMGLGYMLQERVDYNSSGLLESVGTWEYKPPLAQDIPSIFNVTLLAGAPNSAGILRSKAVGEPSIILANSVYFATKMAIKSCRIDSGDEEYFDVDAPLTIDRRYNASRVSPSRYVMPL